MHRPWSPELWQRLESVYERAKSEQDEPLIAAFDADGTLWDTDLGEGFFRYQIANCGLKGLPKDPWGHYASQKDTEDPRAAYLWLAQINEGQPLSRVKDWAEKSVQSLSPLPIFDDQKNWILKLQDWGVEVYVVTASVRWAVEPGARRLGIDEKHVLGVETRVIDGIVTAEAHGHMTYKQGKVDALLAATKGKRPFFCSGNSTGDTSLLKSATHGALAVTAAVMDVHGGGLVQSEQGLQAEAEKQGWLRHRFV